MKINHFCYLCLGLVLTGCLFFSLPLWLGMLLVNLLTLWVYGWDKLAACKGWQRVPETTLLLFGVVGGWLGAILGQWLFRHKTQKQPFRTYFILSVVLNLLLVLAAGYWFYGRMVV
ncbi:hypothetical protein Z042_21675 [Chania multitudinisentens RB-25]|uniref:DNA-binding protein n=1 Tax=Chania multitudinisentens RB-25 TaxID=1441930 RepID=W0LDL7_9GAMM|nr:DUF1294 domain-containing protein [Chania multitudinisentens]AHG21928.1 hypothetical protein Z042_21675 [Chania multitudinisentens RB-25]